MRRTVAALVVGLLVACSAPSSPRSDRMPDAVSPERSGEAPAASPEPSVAAAAVIPKPDSPLPRSPARLARRLTTTTRALLAAIDRWRSEGGTGDWPPPREVVLLALDQQRINQVLGSGRSRRGLVLAALPPALRPIATQTSKAASSLARGLRGIVVDTPVTMRIRPPLGADVLRRFYDEAAKRFDVPWTLLAAIHFIETKFGRVVSPSWAGAQGPMQFIPSTWAAYGMGGDVHDPRDAILGAANYLRANGAPAERRRALWAYNPVEYYRDAVLAYEAAIRRDQRMFYALYNWQVFVRTRAGLVQVSGPGSDVR